MITEQDSTPADPRSSCTIVIVNWNSGDHLKQCLLSIPTCFPVVVVDNASSDTSLAQAVELLRHGAPAVGRGARTPVEDWCKGKLFLPTRTGNWLFLRQDSNRGFAGAANEGAARSTADFILFLNPDVRFAEESSACAMLFALQNDPRAAAATGRLEPLDQGSGASHRTSVTLIRPLPTLASALSDVLFLDEIMNRQKPALPAPGEIEQAPGACFLIRRSVFEALGGFDEKFYPAWFEDVDLCKRMRDRGLKILYEPRSVFYHQGGHSLQNLSMRQFRRSYYGNMVRYFKKHHGLAAAAVLKGATLAGNMVRGVMSG